MQIPADTTEEFERAFGQQVREQRLRYKLSQKALSDALEQRGMKIDPSAIARLEKGGRRGIRLGEAMALAQELDIDITVMAAEYDLPSSRFGQLRQAADHSLNAAREHLGELAETLQHVAAVVDRSPEVLAGLQSAEEVSDGVSYLKWVHGRIAALVEQPFFNVEAQGPYAPLVRKICAELARNVVVTRRELERFEQAREAALSGEA